MRFMHYTIQFGLPKGVITVEGVPAKPGSPGAPAEITLRYMANDKQRYRNVPIKQNPTGTWDHEIIRTFLSDSWVNLGDEPNAVQDLEDALDVVAALATGHSYEDIAVGLRSEEFGNERFGPYTTLNTALAASSRIAQKSFDEDDGVERIVGPIINDEEDWRDDEDDFDDEYDED